MINAQVIKPNLSHFGQFPEVEVINGDEMVWENQYLVCVDYFSVYLVIADNEQDALDELADYFEERDYTGYFLSDADHAEHIENDWPVEYCGNHDRAMAFDQIIIEQLN